MAQIASGATKVMKSNGRAHASITSNTNGDLPIGRQKYDPRALLDPKGFSKRSTPQKDATSSKAQVRQPAFKRSSTNDSADTGSPGRQLSTSENSRDGANGMVSAIEKLHGVTHRDQRPAKRMKLESRSQDDGNEKKAKFGTVGKGGVLGEYVKMKKEEGREINPQSTSVVDLTAGDDEDITVISDTSRQEVCYGMIMAKVSAYFVPSPSLSTPRLSPDHWPTIQVKLITPPDTKTQIIQVLDPHGNNFGNVDVCTACGLAPLMNAPKIGIRTQAWIPIRKIREDEAVGQQVSDRFELRINVYGLRRYATEIGRHLGQKNIWFRAPSLVMPGFEVCNPHKDKPLNIPKFNQPASGPGSGFVSRSHEEIRNDVLGVFDSLEKSSELPEMEPDPRILTPLLKHQKQGLHFLTMKEKPMNFDSSENEIKSLWKLNFHNNGQRSYYNIITGKEERVKPRDALGGILADMMGLGKTLSVLALILATHEDSLTWSLEGSERPSTQQLLSQKARTTLLVAPLSTLANWEEQIKAHIQPESLSYYVFHGPNRIRDVEHLKQFDVILTTYNIVGSEFDKAKKGRSNTTHGVLEQINWFRIVLDEAHMIREQSTRACKAICSLAANRRWAVTGTPVQNRLDDLGALIKFLRISPFDEKNGFSQYILAPFKNADTEILPKLRVLVDSFTLRRLKDRIDLPKRFDNIVRLEFDPTEREIYELFAHDSANKVNMVAGGRQKALGGKAYAQVLKAILRLRLLCAHGRELLGEDDMKILEGQNLEMAIDLDGDENSKPKASKALTPKQAYEMFNLMKETNADKCAQCDKKIEPSDSFAVDAAEGKDETVGYMTPCYHIICKDCFRGIKKQFQERDTGNGYTSCPFCETYVRIDFFEIKQNQVDDDEEARMIAKDNPRSTKKAGKYFGPHTKTKALLECLFNSEDESAKHPEEPPIKSVIFSGWTSHLDLIQVALEHSHLAYVRLDGKMTRTARTKALDTFRDDTTVRIILVSIAAGGLGLNLTTASKVYVMEPQFNPAAEAQATDRVHRLGQKREVTCTRFIMNNSFEEKMLDLQRKKQNLADLSMSRGKLDKQEAARRKLEELRSLFK